MGWVVWAYSEMNLCELNWLMFSGFAFCFWFAGSQVLRFSGFQVFPMLRFGLLRDLIL